MCVVTAVFVTMCRSMCFFKKIFFFISCINYSSKRPTGAEFLASIFNKAILSEPGPKTSPRRGTS